MSNGQVDIIVSKKAIDEIQVATNQLEKLRKKILQVNKASAKGGGGVSGNKDISLQIQRTNQLIIATNRLIQSQNKLVPSTKKNTTATKKNAKASKELAAVNKKVTSSFQNLARNIALMFGAQGIVQLAKDVFNLVKELNSISFSMKTVIKDSFELRQTQVFLSDIARKYGADLVTVTNRYVKFRAAAKEANLTSKQTQEIFASVTKAAGVLGLKTDELKGIYLALEQMISKGKITTEELRRQLGERLPGAMDIMAKSMGVTTAKLDEMLKKGEVITKDVLPAFAAELEKSYGIESIELIDNLAAAQSRLSTAFTELVSSIEEDGNKISNVFKGFFEDFTEIIVQIEKMNRGASKDLRVAESAGYDKRLGLIEDTYASELKLLEENGIDKITKTEFLNFELLRLQKKYTKEFQYEAIRAASLREDLRVVDVKLDGNRFGSGEDSKQALEARKKQLETTIALGRARELAAASLRGEMEALKEMLKVEEQIEPIIDEVGEAIEKITTNSKDAWDKNTKALREQLNGLDRTSVAWEVLNSILKVTDSTYDKLFKSVKKTNDVLKEPIKSNTENAFIEQIKFLTELQAETEVGSVAWNTYKYFIDLVAYSLKGLKGELIKTKEEIEKGLTETEQYQLALDNAQKYADAIGDLGNAIHDRKIARIDEEIRREQDKYAILFAFAEGDANQTRLLAIQREEDLQKLEAKRRKQAKKQAIFNKALAVVDIGIKLAQTIVAINLAAATIDAVTFGVGGTAYKAVQIPLAIGVASLQLAAVAAQPVPEFAEGGIMDHDGAAIVGDGGKREVIRTPDGKISLTPAKDTVVNIPKGTEIFPSIEDFNNEQPNDLEDRIYSATLLASISLNQKNIEGMMFSQRELDQRLLDEMIKNTKAVRDSKSNLNVKTQSIDIPHQMWKNKFLS